jgi:hypothetical protein
VKPIKPWTKIGPGADNPDGRLADNPEHAAAIAVRKLILFFSLIIPGTRCGDCRRKIIELYLEHAAAIAVGR